MSIKSHRIVALITGTLLFTAFNFPVSEEYLNETSPVHYNACSIENRAFLSGEEIVYKIYYNWNFVWLAAGEVTFKSKRIGGSISFVSGWPHLSLLRVVL